MATWRPLVRYSPQVAASLSKVTMSTKSALSEVGRGTARRKVADSWDSPAWEVGSAVRRPIRQTLFTVVLLVLWSGVDRVRDARTDRDAQR
ncbi:MAG: hypothetical protein QOD57_1917 [Actinomycetota bacterium]|nr:hypothetical protein [Actinomycetota bacterium]